MRISDWSSDVCSADLATAGAMSPGARMRHSARRSRDAVRTAAAGWPGCRARDVCPTNAIANREEGHEGSPDIMVACGDRKSVVSGKSVAGRVELGGRRTMKKKKQRTTYQVSQY